jgi:hypothetical protein
MRNMTLSKFARSWQLVLLAFTSVVLSIASGWTTWLGMRNFTDESVLSFLITFGIQGVMLVLSWLIGSRLSEFTAQQEQPQRDDHLPGSAALKGLETALKAFAVAAFCLLLLTLYTLLFVDAPAAQQLTSALQAVPSKFVAALFFLAIIALVLLRYGTRIVDHIVSLAQFAGRNAVPLVMLVGCLLTSVFFSFDALFSTIMPQAERERIAELRSKTEVAAIINRISETAGERRQQNAEQLLRSPAWTNYRADLDGISRNLDEAPDRARQHLTTLRQAGLAETRERATALETLNQEKAAKLARKSRLEAQIAAERDRNALLQSEITDLNQESFALDRQIVAKEAERDAEERGLGASSVAGRGPEYRRLTGELDKLTAARANIELKRSRLEQALQRNLAASDTLLKQVATLEGELRSLDSRVALAEGNGSKLAAAPSVADVTRDSSRHHQALAAARLAFERTPTPENLGHLQAACTEATGFLTAMAGAATPAAGNSNPQACTASAVQTAAGRTFALDQGLARVADRCVGKNAELVNRSLEQRLAFARDCLNWSGIQAANAGPIIASINRLERERDDKAHRFVVTSNAFFDGNKLALLAIAIAGAIDVLVLASGLIGATAIRSPLAAARLNAHQTAAQREAIITAALLPDIAGNARLALESFTPRDATSGGPATDDWTHQLDLGHVRDAPRLAKLRKLVNAATAIGAARHADGPADRHLLKSPLIEFLAHLSEAARDTSDPYLDLPQALASALGNEAIAKADKALAYIVPSVREAGYSSGIDISTIETEDEDILRRCLNVATAYNLVSQSETSGSSTIVLLKPQFYFAMLDLATTPRQPVEADTAEPEQPGQPVETSSAPPAQAQPHGQVAVTWPARPSTSVKKPEPVPDATAETRPTATAPAPHSTAAPRAVASAAKPRPRVIITNDTFRFD